MSRKQEIQDAKEEAMSLVQMYQSGFLDGYYHRLNLECSSKTGFIDKREQKVYWKAIRKQCKKSFELRFMKTAEEQVKINNNLNKQRKK